MANDYGVMSAQLNIVLRPLFPINSLSTLSECAHNGPIKQSSLVCMICHQSAWDKQIGRGTAKDAQDEDAKREPDLERTSAWLSPTVDTTGDDKPRVAAKFRAKGKRKAT